MSGLRFRPANPGDVATLRRLYADSVKALGPSAYSPEQVEAWAAFADEEDDFRAFVLGALTLVAEDERGVVGFGGLQSDGRIASLYVHPDASGEGIGSAILGRLLEIGRGRLQTRFRAEASELSRRTFEAQGFRVANVEMAGRDGVRIRRYRMVRELAAVD